MQWALTTSSALLFWLACAVSGQAGDGPDLNFVGRLNTAIRNAVAEPGNPRDAAMRLCEDVSGSLLDLQAMMITASAGAYNRLDSPHREAYRAAFLRRVVKDCVTNAAPYMGADVELAGVRSLPSGERIIGTRSRASAEKILMWQTRLNAAGGLVVTDVLVDGRSAMLSLREQASLALERDPGDINALIQSLER